MTYNSYATMRTFSLLAILCSCIILIESLSALVSKRVKPWENDPICGLPKYAPMTAARVVGGDKANPHSWPWRAMIICHSRTNSTLCGGSIVSDQWVLTAAHCMESRLYNISGDCTVFVGRHYLPTRQLSTLEATQQTFRIVHYVIHENYNDTDLPLGYDLALVKLSRVIKFTKEVLPICLPFNQPELTEASVCYSGGWGYTETPKPSASQTLKQIRIPIQVDDYCSFTSRSALLGIIICTGKWDRAQNLCYGDSGGPLECKSNSRWYLHGVLSQVDKRCVSVASFAKVTKFRDWIENNII